MEPPTAPQAPGIHERIDETGHLEMMKEVIVKERERPVDGFRFLPPGLAAWFRTFVSERDFEGSIPWTPLTKPLNQTTFALVTSAGISLRTQPPFDMEREKREPTWGDPTYRAIPRGTTGKDIEVNHLHINTKHILEDINVIFPLLRMAELEEEGVIGRLAPTSYSFYGFQFQGTGFLETAIAPMLVTMKREGVDAALLSPA
jgi:D-proline reductase (dithiol) PrdB